MIAMQEAGIHVDLLERQLRGGPTVALIPVHNEEPFIGSLVLLTRRYVDVVVVVDDGSNDQTVNIARAAGATVVQKSNGGKASAVNAGFAFVRIMRPSAVVMLDGDGQHSADDIPHVLAPVLRGEADVVVGSRFLQIKSQIPVYRQVGQHGLTLVTNIASGVYCSDSQSGFRAFSGSAVEQLSFNQNGFSIESEMQFLAREHNLRVAEASIKVTYAEKAKRNPVTHGMEVLNGIVRLVGQTRPLFFFGTSGLSLLTAGGALGFFVVDIYRRTHTLAVGYGLLTVLLSLMGMLLLFAGVLLHCTRAMIVDVRRNITAEPAADVEQWVVAGRQRASQAVA